MWHSGSSVGSAAHCTVNYNAGFTPVGRLPRYWANKSPITNRASTRYKTVKMSVHYDTALYRPHYGCTCTLLILIIATDRDYVRYEGYFLCSVFLSFPFGCMHVVFFLSSFFVSWAAGVRMSCCACRIYDSTVVAYAIALSTPSLYCITMCSIDGLMVYLCRTAVRSGFVHGHGVCTYTVPYIGVR